MRKIVSLFLAVIVSVITVLPVFAETSSSSSLDIADWAMIAAEAGYEVIDTQAELLDNYCDDLYLLYLGACKNGTIAEALVAAWLRTGAFSFETSTSGLPVMKGILEAGELVKSKIDDESFSPFHLEYLDGTVDESVTSDDVANVSGEVFNDVVERLNQQYGPAQKTDRRIVSIQNPVHQSYGVDGYGWSYNSNSGKSYRAYIPIRLGSDLFLGQDLYDVWLFPFLDDNDNGTVYYCQWQVHLYHKTITNDDGTNTVCLYVDYYDNIDGVVSTDILCTNRIASYPYLTVLFGQDGTSFGNIYGFQNYSKFLKFENSLSLGRLYDGNSNNCTAYCYSSDGITVNKFNTLIQSDTFDPIADGDDCGFIVSAEKFDIGFMRAPLPDVTDNYYITINGDNIYDYSITNPDTGESSTINYYITNNYTFPDNGSGDDDGGESGGSTSGDITVSGNIDVGGSVDVNVNINDNSSGSDQITVDNFDINEYLDDAPEQAEPLTTFLAIFFDFLPVELLGLIVMGVAVSIWLRIFGR